MTYLSGKTVLVTGGAGSLGQHLIKSLMSTEAASVRVFDSDEYGLFLAKKRFDAPRLRFLLGDVRDRDRMTLALKGVDCVVHAAASKNLEVTEYNMAEAVRVNIVGTINLLETSIALELEKFLFVSSDKAVHFSTLYGATKFVGEQLISWATQVSDNAYSSIRMGNFIESRGNVFDIWERQSSRNELLTLTSTEMARYFIETKDAARLVVKALQTMEGGETYVPKMKLYSMFEMMKTLYPGSRWKETGIRKGEKVNEELMTPHESKIAEEQDEFWVIRGK